MATPQELNELTDLKAVYTASFCVAALVLMVCVGLAVTSKTKADDIQSVVLILVSACWCVWSGLIWSDTNKKIKRLVNDSNTPT